VLYVGTLLHDLGLAEDFHGPDRFEARGANVVREVLLDRGMSPNRAGNVWDIIALHATSTLAAHKSPETNLANRGISVDVRGKGHEHLDPADVRTVLDTWPRQTFPMTFEAALSREVQANPSTARFCWMESVAVEYVPGYQAASFLDSLRASADFA
jgi:hypothetical protein